LTFIRPTYPSDIGGLPDIPPQIYQPRRLYLDPAVVVDVVKENPEYIHYGAMVAAELLMLSNPYTRPVAIAVPGITVAGHELGHWLWDRATDWFPSDGSSESSSLSYQQNGGSGGTPPSRRFKNIDAIPAGSRVTKASWKTTKTDYIGNSSKGYHYCKKGWLLVRVGDTNMCWKPPRKKKS